MENENKLPEAIEKTVPIGNKKAYDLLHIFDPLELERHVCPN